MEHKLRFARVEDSLEISRLSEELGYAASSAEIYDRLSELLHDNRHCILVVDATIGLLGWIAAERRLLLESGFKFEIVGLVVDTSVRRTGVGRKLVRAIEDWAKQQGAIQIHVRSNIARRESHVFYEELGYIKRKTQHNYTRGLSV